MSQSLVRNTEFCCQKDGLKTTQNRISGFWLQRSIKWFDLFGCSRYKTHQNMFLSLSGLKCLSNRRHSEVFSAQCVTLKLNWTDEELTHQDVGAVQRVEVGERSPDRWCCFKSRGAFFQLNQRTERRKLPPAPPSAPPHSPGPRHSLFTNSQLTQFIFYPPEQNNRERSESELWLIFRVYFKWFPVLDETMLHVPLSCPLLS